MSYSLPVVNPSVVPSEVGMDDISVVASSTVTISVSISVENSVATEVNSVAASVDTLVVVSSSASQ